MKKIFAIALATLMLWGCAERPKSYTVKGTIAGYEGDIALASEKTGKIYASTSTTDGTFKLEVESETPLLTALVIDGQTTMPIFLESPGKTVKVKGDFDKLNMITASGSTSNDAFRDYINESNKLIAELETPEKTQHDYYEYYEKAGKLLDRTFEENQGNLWGVYLLTMGKFQSMKSEEILKALDKIPAKLASTPEVVELREQVIALMKTEIGQPYTDITMVDPNGRMIKLSDWVEKGRYILLDFWASWCNPCMKEMPYLKEAYDKFYRKGFQIYAVNLDDGRQPWVDAINKVGMPWLHVGTQGGWESHATETYMVRSIPANFLIDCETGLIVDRNLRGEQLIERLDELFSK